MTEISECVSVLQRWLYITWTGFTAIIERGGLYMMQVLRFLYRIFRGGGGGGGDTTKFIPQP